MKRVGGKRYLLYRPVFLTSLSCCWRVNALHLLEGFEICSALLLVGLLFGFFGGVGGERFKNNETEVIFFLCSSISGVANYIHMSPLGILLPRTAGKLWLISLTQYS